MADQGLNFRSTAAYVTDGADDTYVQGAGSSIDSYPTTRGGITFGWLNITVDHDRDRDNGIDVRLAGTHFCDATAKEDFQIDLDGLGGATTYNITAAFGDAQYDRHIYCDMLDNTTAFNPLSVSQSGTRFVDAAGTGYSAANWPGSNSTISRAFSSNTFVLRIGDGSTYYGWVAHLSFNWTPGTTQGLTYKFGGA